MRNNFFLVVSILSQLLCTAFLSAQDSTQSCKVLFNDLAGVYKGDCKNGVANGQGEAKGYQHYTGSFKNGMPSGQGTYYYSDSMYYTGNFQDGIKEGKGEAHYLRNGIPDSIIRGYWSGDEFRGKSYTTYLFKSSIVFDQVDISPSPQSGNTLTIEISTTSGAPDGTQMNLYNNGKVLVLDDLVSTSGSTRLLSKKVDIRKSSTTFEIDKFPAKFIGTLSNGGTFILEFYKSANWRVRLYMNM